MCGLGLVFQPTLDLQRLEERLSRLNAVQRHRGPDGVAIATYQVGEHAILGMAHQRLSILDLSSRAAQPMQSACGRYVLCYNGEIYNYKELASILGVRALLEPGAGDTSVLLAALMHWGVDALPRLNGMWAFALLDREQNTLLIARDRLGVKPLYWSLANGGLLLASEVKGIVALSGSRFALNKDSALRHMLQSLGNTGCATLFEGIQAMPAASYARINLLEPPASPEFTRFWQHRHPPGAVGGKPATPEQLHDLLVDAVRLRLRSDVPCGLLLSGGIDSSSILGAARELGADLQVLSAVSRDPNSNEEYWINQAARFNGVKTACIHIDDNPLSMLDELAQATWHNDQPVGGFSVIAHRRLMAAARDMGITVLLSGQGSDEQLGGYNKFLYFYVRECLERGRVAEAAGLLWNCFKRGTVIDEFQFSEAKRYLPRWLSRSGGHLGPALAGARVASLGDHASFVEREWLDLTSLSLPMLLHSEDRMSMSCGREIRLPFLDFRLVELLASIPSAQKFHGGWPKWPLRQAMRHALPSSICWRRDKKGFNIPEAQWLKTSFKPRMDALFASDLRCADLGLVRPDAVRQLYRRYCEGDSRVSYKEVLNVVTMESWLQVFGDALQT
jgi:asparagine synthase (glutamine-hydrolysing)